MKAITRSSLITIAIVLVIVVLFLTGFLLDFKGFLVNLIASAITVILTVTVINWFLIRQRRNQWKRVRSQIITALLNHIGNMTSEYSINIQLPREYDLIAYVEQTGKGYDTPTAETAWALKEMAKKMRTAPIPHDSKEQAEKVHKLIKWDIEQIRSVLLPRILAMETEEPELVHILSELDSAERRWVNQYIMDEEVSAGDQFGAAIDFLKCMADVYQYIVDQVDNN